jgi:hypothetical protein
LLSRLVGADTAVFIFFKFYRVVDYGNKHWHYQFAFLKLSLFYIYLRSGGKAALRLSAPTYNMPTWHFLPL